MSSSIEEKIRVAGARNNELLAVLSETDHAGPSLEEQDRFLGNLRSEIQVSNHTLASLEKKRKKELKEHEDYRDSIVRRWAYKATGKKEKFEQRAAQEEREYFDVLQNEHQANEKRKQLDMMLADALKVRDELFAALARHNQAQQDLDSLYDSIFQGPSPGFPEEDAKETESGQALQLYRDARVKAEAEGQAVRILNDSAKMMQNAKAAMLDALHSSRADMWGGGATWDMMERNALSRAEESINAVNMLINQAMFMSPQVKPLPAVNIDHGHLISDMLFDNIFTDMAFHDKIKESSRQVDLCAAAVNRNLNEAQKRHAALMQTMNIKAKELESARFVLKKAREAAFRTVTGEQGNTPVASFEKQ